MSYQDPMPGSCLDLSTKAAEFFAACASRSQMTYSSLTTFTLKVLGKNDKLVVKKDMEEDKWKEILARLKCLLDDVQGKPKLWVEIGDSTDIAHNGVKRKYAGF